MPHIAVTMYPGRTTEQKLKLAKKIQSLVIEELGVDSKVVSVSVEDIPQDKWKDNIAQFPNDVMYIKSGM